MKQPHRHFISLSYKMIATILILLTLIIGIYGYFSQRHLHAELQKDLQRDFIHYKNDYNFLIQQLTDHLIVLGEQIGNFVLHTGQDRQQSSNSLLLETWPNLQLLANIDSIALYEEGHTKPLLKLSAQPNNPGYNISQQVLSSKLPESKIECHTICSLFVGIPLHFHQESQALVMRTSLLQTMLEFSRLNLLNVALLTSSSDQKPLLNPNDRYISDWKVKVPALTNGPTTFSIITRAASRIPLKTLSEESYELNFEGSSYMLRTIPIHSRKSENHAQLLLVKNITQQKLALRNNLQNLFIFALVTVLLLALLGSIVSMIPLRRMRKLANQLPLLAQHRYREFRESIHLQTPFILDEVDLLTDATSTLSENLEQMQKQIDEKTQQLERIAMYDALTGLANRAMFLFQLEQSLATLGRTSQLMAIVFLDLDKFKAINDTLGHQCGDELLKVIAHRITHCVREMDLVCRLGGDEFTVIINGLHQRSDVEIIMEKISYEMNRPIFLSNRNLLVTTSAGVTFADSHKISSEELLKQADIAMYEAKRKGRNRYCIFHKGMFQQAVRTFAIETEFAEAVEKGHLRLYFQPKVDATTNQLYGFEALVRWMHPEQGLILPSEFIPILEETAHINTLGNWVAMHAIELITMLDKNGFPDLDIAINLSARQFSDPDLLRHLLAECKKHQFSPHRLELEVTETVMIKDFKATQQMMRAMKKHQFRLAIDDFGTGYSSLSYLNKLPFDTVKFDHSFIMKITRSQSDQQFIGSLINMVQLMRCKAVAEGVESSQQMDLLQSLGCDIIQGNYISKPIPEESLISMLQEHLHQNNIWR